MRFQVVVFEFLAIISLSRPATLQIIPLPSQTSLSLYRSLLRVVLNLDQHRGSLVCFRIRKEFEDSRALLEGSPEQLERLAEGETYLDNISHQANHLKQMSTKSLLIPIDLRAEYEVPKLKDRRKLIRAIGMRGAEKPPVVSKSNNRFMEGPEPSWLRKKAEGMQEASWNQVLSRKR